VDGEYRLDGILQSGAINPTGLRGVSKAAEEIHRRALHPTGLEDTQKIWGVISPKG